MSKLRFYAILDHRNDVVSVIGCFPGSPAPANSVPIDPDQLPVGPGWAYYSAEHEFRRFDGENGLGEWKTIPAGSPA